MYASGITYSSVTSAASGLDFEGAQNGLSLAASGSGFKVVLGQDIGELGDPAKLLNDREVPMEAQTLNFKFDFVDAVLKVGDQNGGSGFQIPLLWVSDDSSNWCSWQPANFGIAYTFPFGIGERFYSGYSRFPGVNEPTTDRPNVVGMFWGYNTSYTNGRINTGEAAFRFATETFFVIGTDPNFEFHTPEMTTQAGVIIRLDSTYVSRTTGIGFRQIVIDDVAIYSELFPPSTGQFYYDAQYNNIADVAKVSINSQNAAGVSVLELGNWTDGIGNCFIDFQSGNMDIACIGLIDIRSPRVIMDSSDHGNIVNPTVSSANNTDTPFGDEMLGVQSTVKGFRLPAMTTIQRLAMTPVAVGGLLVFDSDIAKAYIWNSAAWEQIQSL